MLYSSRDGMPIKSFRHKGLRQFFEEDNLRGIAAAQAEKLADILAAIDAANSVEEIGKFPGWRLHPLKGDLQGFWSVTVTGNWRLIFRFKNGEASELDLIDYH